MILGPEDLVMQVKANLMKQFKYNNWERLKEYVGNKIKYVGDDTIQFVQRYCYRATATRSSWERNVSTRQLFQELY
jgi:hypothetical protein